MSEGPAKAFSPPHRLRARRGIIAGALLLLVAGCGGGDGDSRRAALGPGGKDERHRATIDRVCYTPEPPQPGGAQGDLRELGRLAEEQAGFRERMLEQLSTLELPGSVRGDVERFISAARPAVGMLRQQATAARAGDETRYREVVVALNQELRKAAAVANDLGLDRCAEPVTRPGVQAGAVQQDVADAGDEICAEANQRILSDPAPDPADLRAAARSYASALATRTEAAEELRSIAASGQSRAALDLFRSILDDRVRLAMRLRDAARRGDTDAVANLTAADAAVYGRENATATRFGFEVCGQSGTVGI